MPKIHPKIYTKPPNIHLYGVKNFKPCPQNGILVPLQKVNRIGTSMESKKIQTTPTKQDLGCC